MGRPRLNRRTVTYSLGKDTLDRLDALRQHKQDRLKSRTTRVTLSEIIDDAVALSAESKLRMAYNWENDIGDRVAMLEKRMEKLESA